MLEGLISGGVIVRVEVETSNGLGFLDIVPKLFLGPPSVESRSLEMMMT
jgi:hypothetical protein